MGKRVSDDRFERQLSSFALLVSPRGGRPFSRPLKRLFLPRRYSNGVQRRSDSDRALSFESTAHTLQDSVRAGNYAILGMPCITRFSLFAALNKSTNIRAATGNGTVCRTRSREPVVTRGNATPPNMNRSLINAQAINRRIIVVRFCPGDYREEWDSSKPERYDARQEGIITARFCSALRRKFCKRNGAPVLLRF